MMKKFKDHNKHLKRFVCLATFLFVVIGIISLARILFSWELVIGEFVLSPTVDVLLAFIALCMATMGVYYAFAKD